MNHHGGWLIGYRGLGEREWILACDFDLVITMSKWVAERDVVPYDTVPSNTFIINNAKTMTVIHKAMSSS